VQFSEKKEVRRKQKQRLNNNPKTRSPGGALGTAPSQRMKKRIALFVVLPSVISGKTFLAGPVKNRFKHIDLKIVLPEEVPSNFIQKLAVRVDEGAAGFTFKMKMFPAFFRVFYILIAGTFVIM
jgi:hypothetical protein